MTFTTDREPLIKWERHLLHSKEAEGKAATQEHPPWAVTAAPTQPPASFQCNPKGWNRLGRLSALLAKGKTAAGIAALLAP